MAKPTTPLRQKLDQLTQDFVESIIQVLRESLIESPESTSSAPKLNRSTQAKPTVARTQAKTKTTTAKASSHKSSKAAASKPKTKIEALPEEEIIDEDTSDDPTALLEAYERFEAQQRGESLGSAPPKSSIPQSVDVDATDEDESAPSFVLGDNEVAVRSPGGNMFIRRKRAD